MKKKDQIALLEAALKNNPDNRETQEALKELKKHKYRAIKIIMCSGCGSTRAERQIECECGGGAWHTFDSKREAEYYGDLLKLKRAKEITRIELQPEYILQDSFTKRGKTHLAIKYRADFRVTYQDGTEKVIDVKGFETPEFKIKRKMFEKRYPELELVIV